MKDARGRGHRLVRISLTVLGALLAPMLVSLVAAPWTALGSVEMALLYSISVGVAVTSLLLRRGRRPSEPTCRPCAAGTPTR